jgi:hypothetical protein
VQIAENKKIRIFLQDNCPPFKHFKDLVYGRNKNPINRILAILYGLQVITLEQLRQQKLPLIVVTDGTIYLKVFREQQNEDGQN